MAKSSNQKKKILYVMKAFLEKTDETHALSSADILAYLESYDISAERKSIYRDIEELQLFGFDIELSKELGGYYLADRLFELPELKLLVDVVQSSKFITYKKSEELIKKLESLTSNYEGKQLQRQVVVYDRIKTMNESIYYNVDDIQTAISENKKVSFLYYEWTVEKEKRLRKDGKRYVVSPWLLVWDNENYYLVAYDGEAVKHYRVDKMLKMDIIDEAREGAEHFEHMNAAKYAKRTFGMFGGETITVTLECENYFAGIMIDRFGTEVPFRKIDAEHFQARVEVRVSEQFFGWILALGNGVKIQKPDSVKEQFKNYIADILKQY